MLPPVAACTRKEAHQAVSCTACHTTWAPSCIGCHNQWEPNARGYDMLHDNQPVLGSWVEYAGIMSAAPPALGVSTDTTSSGDLRKEVLPAIPGMILTIDMHSFNPASHDSLIFHRLFAPAQPHTISAKGRHCKSCHNSPQALGFGKGSLTYVVSGRYGHWKFTSDYVTRPEDGLPEDAWTGFLQERDGPVSTRSNFRPFNIQEQQKILTVGACLTCHPENSKVMQKSLTRYQKELSHLSPNCILPDWNDVRTLPKDE